MIKKVTVYRVQFTVLVTIFLLLLLYPIPYTLTPTYAQSTSDCGGGTPARATGLVSAPAKDDKTKFLTSGACIIDPKVAFAPFKIPTFDDLKSLYYTQATTSSTVTKHAVLTGDKTEKDIPLTDTDHLYTISDNLTISNNITGNQSGVIFVDGNLTIKPSNNKLTHGSTTSGLMFVVRGDVNINQSVTRVDAVIISEGIICTAFDGTICPSGLTDPATTSQLIINGSLISLKSDKPIKFRRTLSDNSQPAEVINHQVKYLVILRNLISDTYQKWSEVGTTTLPSPLPIFLPSPSPSPTPVPCSSGLLSNGCFENGLANWGCGGAVSGTCILDSSEKYAGASSAKVTNTGGSWGWQLSQGNISASKGEQFCLSVWVKKQTDNHNVSIAIQETAYPGGTRWLEQDLYAANTTNWQLVKQTVTVGSDWYPPIQVFLRVWSNGTAWFDDVSLIKNACP